MMMRKHKIQGAYEEMKKITRGAQVSEKLIRDFVRDLEMEERDKQAILELKPSSYTGYAEELALEVNK